MAFVKLDCGLLRSTLWIDKPARDLFITALLLAEPQEFLDPVEQIEVRTLNLTGWSAPPGWYGFVPAAGCGIIRLTGIEEELGYLALERLGAPDPESRSQDFEGRRLIRIDGGYMILNYDRYRNKDHTAAIRQRRWRDRQRNSVTSDSNGVTDERNGVTTRNVTQAEAEAEAEREGERAPAREDSWEDRLRDAGCKISKKSFRRWHLMVEKHGVDVVFAAASTLKARERWDDAVADILAERPAPTPALVPKPPRVRTKVQRHKDGSATIFYSDGSKEEHPAPS